MWTEGEPARSGVLEMAPQTGEEADSEGDAKGSADTGRELGAPCATLKVLGTRYPLLDILDRGQPHEVFTKVAVCRPPTLCELTTVIPA